MILIIAVSISCIVYCLILMLFSAYGLHYDAINKRLASVANSSWKEIPQDEELNKPLSERLIKPLLKGFLESFSKYFPEESNGKNNRNSKQVNKLKRLLRQADIKLAVIEYKWIRFLIMAGTTVIAAIVSTFSGLSLVMVLFISLICLYTVFVIFRFHLTTKITKRHNNMEKQIPEVLDMLSISVESGLGLEQAMIYVVNNFHGPLIDEIAISNREMAMGRTRRDALINLGERCEIDEIKTFVRAIVQAGELGISIKNVLRSQSAFMRQSRKSKIEEKAMQISVKILIPMVLFIFPVIFIILLGPAVVNIVTELL